MKEQEVNPVWNEKKLELPMQEQNHALISTPSECETQTTEENSSTMLSESHSITPLCRHKIEDTPVQRPRSVPVIQATESEPEGMEETEPPTFLHKIGGTTYEVAVHFDQTSRHTFKDKMERLLTHQLEENQG